MLAGVIVFGAWFAFRMKVSKAATALLASALEMTLEPRARPVHTSPTIAGSFGKCAEPRIDTWVDFLGDEPEVCKAFRAPKAPAAKIPDECLALVTPRNSLAWARGLMSCARADAAGLPEGIFTSGHKRNTALFKPWLQAAKVLAWEVRAQVATRQYSLAFETCGDVIASSRDLSWGGALLGSMVGVANVKAIFPACAEAVVGADPASRAKFHAALETIRSTRLTNSQMLRDESVVVGLEYFGFELDPKQRAGLSPELRDRIRPPPSGLLTPSMMALQLVQQQAATADLRLIADLPASERAPLLVGLDEKHRALSELSPSVSSQEKYLRYADEAAALVQLLSAAAHIDVEAPKTTAAYTVTTVDGALELVPVDPAAAKYAIRISTPK